MTMTTRPGVAFTHASAIFSGTAPIKPHRDDCDVLVQAHLCRVWSLALREHDLEQNELLSVKVLLYLQSHENNTGGVSFIRGSHLWPREHYSSLRADDPLFTKHSFEYIPSRAGDVIFFDDRTVHSVGESLGITRASIQMTFVNAAHPFRTAITHAQIGNNMVMDGLHPSDYQPRRVALSRFVAANISVDYDKGAGRLAVPEFQPPSTGPRDVEDKECLRSVFADTLSNWTMSKQRLDGSPKIMVGGLHRGGTTAVARGFSCAPNVAIVVHA